MISEKDELRETTFSILQRLPLKDVINPDRTTNTNTCRIWRASEARKERMSLAERTGTIVEDYVVDTSYGSIEFFGRASRITIFRSRVWQEVYKSVISQDIISRSTMVQALDE